MPVLRNSVACPSTRSIKENSLFHSTDFCRGSLVADTEFGVARVEASEKPADLGYEVDCLILNVPPGQDFYHHANRHLRDLEEVVARKGIREAEDHRRREGVHAAQLPSSLAKRLLINGDEIEAMTNVTNLVVCRFSYLRELLQKVIRVTDRVASAASLEQADYLKF